MSLRSIRPKWHSQVQLGKEDDLNAWRFEASDPGAEIPANPTESNQIAFLWKLMAGVVGIPSEVAEAADEAGSNRIKPILWMADRGS